MHTSFKISYFLVLFIFLIACRLEKEKERYPGFSPTKSGLYYHRHNIGEGKNYPSENDFLEVQLQFKKMNDQLIPVSIFRNEKGLDTLHFSQEKTKFQFYEALSLLSEGDSCTFIMSTHLLFDTTNFSGILIPFNGDSLVKMEAKLIHLKTPKQQEIERISYQRLCAELAADEELVLNHFLDTSSQKFPKIPDENGLYFYLLKKGNGKAAKAGDAITIRYTGTFLNGEKFDNSTYEKEALSFKLGEPGQVIKGIELAIYKMREGDIAKVLLPSSLAFGSKGSAGGIVSPFKTVTFALEILKIN
ncbi:MAG: FKBP-type peptidyl-prolyl cis-trans isomerase [Bacteroidetes bacterium]|nr:FKBP-type peptidyl-prolyl cis-trans isomerase [Bacteroidota bacterium]